MSVSQSEGHFCDGFVPFAVVVLLFCSGQTGFCENVDFSRDIRPILSDKCYQCHGADAGSRQADLRLDRRDDAIAVRNGKAGVLPGDPDASLMIQRILSTDPNEQMPPPDSNKSLTDRQKELLRQWVAQGAHYSAHWAFGPVPQVAVPETISNPWCRNEIDAFVLQRLESVNIRPAAEASRHVLIRRVYQDLLGLLPTPEETQAFVQDSSPDAYSKLVDRLLQSPHYGERWGRHWLDQARYADSHGFTIDGNRTMWPYRDWVIQAINSDMPFDQFTIEQLAGDLLPNATKSQRVATGFHRNTMINQEGGVKPDQYRHEAILDRVNTTGAVWLGLTIGCAQCHSHKFDPVSHDDYYRMYAFFNSCKDANDTGTTEAVYENEMFGMPASELAAIRELQQLKEALQAKNAALKKLESERLKSAGWDWSQAHFSDYGTTANGSFQHLPDGSLLSDRNGDDNDTYRVSFKAEPGNLVAIRLRVLPHPSLPQSGPGLAQNGNFVLTGIEVRHKGKLVEIANAWADHEQNDYPASGTIDKDPKTGWAINVTGKQKDAKPNLAMNAAHEITLVFSTPVSIQGKNNEVTVLLHHAANPRYLIGRFALDYSTATPKIDIPAENALLNKMKQKITSMESQIPGKGLSESQMVMSDLEKLPPTYRLNRGDFLQPAKDEGALEPGVPAALTGHLKTVPRFRNRLDLARWLVSRENPLTARVAVNRVWMHHFGHGLVETENDFGLQGSLPTHPELLDWLAGELMRRNWSMKELHRLILNSATYRQSSDTRPELGEVDPSNHLLARQSRFRVEAEIVRDLALSASGRFASRVGGPSVFPPQPEGVYAFTQSKKSWPESQGPDRYRRTMYTMFYRSAPYPLMTTFDSPDFSSTCTLRLRSDTPLQSLTLANDIVFVELAQGLAERTLAEVPANAEFRRQLDYLFQLSLTRSPEPTEEQLLKDYWTSERNRYRQEQAAARQAAPVATETDLEMIASAGAWVSVARAVLNTDEFITRN